MALQSFFQSATWDPAGLVNHWIKPKSLKLTHLTLNKKQRHYFADKGPSSQSYCFSSSHVRWMWELDYKESWMPKNWCFWIVWCWRRLLRVPWIARRSNQSILKEISPEYSLEGLMLKLKLQSLATWCRELTHLKRPWCWERLKAGREGDNRGWDGWMASPTQWTWVWVNSGSKLREAWCAPFHGVTKSWIWLSDWTELNIYDTFQSPTPVFSLLSFLSPLMSSLHLWVCFLFLIFTSVFYFLDFTYKWDHTAFIFVRLTCFS